MFSGALIKVQDVNPLNVDDNKYLMDSLSLAGPDINPQPLEVAEVSASSSERRYMLRGNLNAARRKFEKAYSLDPGNPVIANNLELLNGSRRFIERPPNNQP